MDRRITYDPGYQFCPIEKNDEIIHYHFRINVTCLNKYIKSHLDEFPLIEIDVSKHFHSNNLIGWEEFKAEHIEAADLSCPIIIGETAPDYFEIGMHPKRTELIAQGYSVFDGLHRIVKAFNQGIKTLNAYVVRMEQHLPFFVDEPGYNNYVNYWNEKINTFEMEVMEQLETEDDYPQK